MDLSTVFGLASVSLMLVFYTIEGWSDWRVLAFAGACVRGILQGAWGVIALRRWRLRFEGEIRPKPAPAGAKAS